MSQRLIRDLLRLARTQPSGHDLAGASESFQIATRREWNAALATLRLHRIESFAWHGIQSQGLAKTVPEAYRNQLQSAHRSALIKNGAHFNALAEALPALNEAGISPVLWKGVVLAGCFYPAIAMRSMDDIDMTLQEGEADAAGAVFHSLGYDMVMRQSDAVYYRNGAGIVFDVHHHVKLFEGHLPSAITTHMRSPYLPNLAMRVLTPEALIAHLAFHADGHRRSMGYVLRWILDLHFVLEKLSDYIAPDKLRGLIPSSEVFVSLMRSLGLLEAEMGSSIPDGLRASLAEVQPLSLEEVLRNRRLAMWGLPGPRGFARLSLGRMSTPSGERRPWPHPSDLIFWPVDRFREGIARAKGKTSLGYQ